MSKYSSGAKIVTDSVAKVEAVLGGTNGMLRDIAKIESRDGTDKDTFTGSSNGIWQVDDIGLKATQDTESHPNLQRQHALIKEQFGIDWSQVTTADLNQPIVAAIAARLHLLNIPEAIPADKAGQAEYWKKYYNTAAGKGTVKKYLKRVQ